MNILEEKEKLNKLIKDRDSLKKYINFGSDINIIEIEEAIESYDKKINLIKTIIEKNE